MTAKTFRTWNATTRADAGTVNDVIDSVADHLGNTRAVCRNSYVHPAVVEAYVGGPLSRSWSRRIGSTPSGLTVPERKTLRR